MTSPVGCTPSTWGSWRGGGGRRGGVSRPAPVGLRQNRGVLAVPLGHQRAPLRQLRWGLRVLQAVNRPELPLAHGEVRLLGDSRRAVQVNHPPVIFPPPGLV